MPSTPSRTTSDVGRQAPNGGAKPKPKGKANTGTSTPLKVNGGPFAPEPKFNNSTVPTPPRPPASPQKKRSKNTKARQKRKERATSYFDQVVRLIAIAFILFTINKCHNDTELKSPVCQAVNQRILQPFVINPFNAFVSHPSVAPVIQSSKPVYAQAAKISRPAVRQIHRFYVTRISPHVAHLERRFRPYARNIQLHYARSIAPHVRTAQFYYARLERAIEPYINQAIAGLLHLWFEIQPKLIPIIEESKFIPDWVREHALIPLLQLREQYVDTHVIKMLQTVEEFGESRDAKSLKSENHITHTRAATSTSSPTTATEPSHSPITTTALGAQDGSTTPEAVTTHAPIVPEEPIAAGYSVIPERPVVPDEPVVPAAAASTTPDEDIDAWLAELQSEAPTASDIPQSEQEEEAEETEEEIAERQRLKDIETANKRADLEQRHSKFEQEIQGLGQSAVNDLRKHLDDTRATASADLNSHSQANIQSLKAEAEKGLKGTEAYARKLQGEARGGAIKVALFEDVCNKVENRFMEAARNVSDTILSWWNELRIEEQKEASTAAEAIKSLALDAQSNLGMDYSWLADVTVADWQRYHALVDSADEYGKQLQDLIDGTHPLSKPNPLEKELAKLQDVLNEIINDFQDSLKIQRGNGIDSFGTINPDTSADADQAPFSFPPGAAARDDGTILQRGKEEVEDAIRKAEAEIGTAAENAQAIFEDGFKQAGEAAHQATRTIIKAAGGTPTPETFQETVQYVAAKASEAAADISTGAKDQYENLASSGSSLYADGAASASSAYSEAASVAASVYSDVAASAHQATRSLSRAAGATPTPETPKEHAESMVAAAASAAHQATRSMSRAAGYTPTPETPSETIGYVGAVIGEHVESVASVASSSASVVAASASSLLNEGARTVIKAAGGTPAPTNVRETVESLAAGAQAYYSDAAARAQKQYANLPSYEELKTQADSLFDRSKALFGAEPAPAGYEKLLNDALALIDEYQSRAHEATRAASRAVGATPTPETFGEHVESVVNAASSIVSSATEVVRSVVHEDL